MTVRICGSLDIQTALEKCMEYIKEVIPVETMNLGLYDPDQNMIRLLASVNPQDPSQTKSFNLLEKQRKGLAQRWQNLKKVEIVNRLDEDPVFGPLQRHLNWSTDSSHMFMRLEMEGRRVGNLVLSAKGNDQYTPAHARLVFMLHDPFAIALANALKHQELLRLKNLLADDNQYLRKQLQGLSEQEIVGSDYGLRGVMEMVRQVAPLDSPVMILGETGVGKDVIANALHRLSNRAEGPFIKVNCGAIPDTLIDSELFGHEKGAFTGALTQKKGRFERAHQGTIFLDEIGELPLHAQVRLLHVVQHMEIERVGGNQPIPVNVRIISATHRNLAEMVSNHQFREDLWFRLNVFPIMIPPLRQRKEDIPILAHYFLEKRSQVLKINEVPIPAPGAIDDLMAYHWPGNIREMQNVVDRALIQHRGGRLKFNVLPAASPSNELPDAVNKDRHSATPMKLDQLTTLHIQKVLQLAQGKINGPGGAAELLGIHPNTLRKRMNKLGIAYGRNVKNSHKNK